MANHVNSYIEFVEINDLAKQKWNEMCSRIKCEDTTDIWFGYLFTNEDISKEMTETYEWTRNNIGPKWCYIDNIDEDGFSTVSAWSAPEIGLEKLLQILEQYDPNMITTFKYEDEMPNFFGCYVYKGSEMIDGREDEDEEIHEMMLNNVDGLITHWNPEEEEFTEEGYDIWNEKVWEEINMIQENCVAEIIQYMKQDV
jgi:hypothetical protein